MKRRIISLVLTFLMLFTNSVYLNENMVHAEESTETMENAIVASGTCGDNATWILNGEGTLTISGTGAIADYSFMNFDDKYAVTNLVMEDGITSIGRYAFGGCSDFTGDLVIPDSVTSIGDFAFRDCSGFTGALLMSDRVASIGNYAFFSCEGFTGDLVLPDSLISIGDYAFFSCESFTGDLILPNSLTMIGDRAFRGCEGFTGELMLPDSLISIGSSAFYSCEGFTGDLVLPDSLTNIGDHAFYRCNGLEKIIFNNGESYIYDSESTLPSDATIVGHKGSTAEEYAEKYNRTFKPLGTEDVFNDISEDQYYYEPVLWAVENKITDGWTDTEFAPDMDCTRGQVITFLWRAKGCPEPNTTKNPFTDVNSTDYYYKAVLWAVENGITSGWTDTTFAPDMTCTRGQVVTFFWRATNKPGTETDICSFTDVASDAYYYDAVLWAVEADITDGWTETTFAPDMICTRGQIVTFLWRYCN